MSADTLLDGITFASGASAYTIKLRDAAFYGAGVTNNSGIIQNFLCSASPAFYGSATAGDLTAYAVKQDMVFFDDESSSASAIFTIESHLLFLSSTTRPRETVPS